MNPVFDDRFSILYFLAEFNPEPQKPLTIAKAIGKKTAADVNPILYRLRDEGLVERLPRDGPKPTWKLIAKEKHKKEIETPQSMRFEN